MSNIKVFSIQDRLTDRPINSQMKEPNSLHRSIMILIWIKKAAHFHSKAASRKPKNMTTTLNWTKTERKNYGLEELLHRMFIEDQHAADLQTALNWKNNGKRNVTVHLHSIAACQQLKTVILHLTGRAKKIVHNNFTRGQHADNWRIWPQPWTRKKKECKDCSPPPQQVNLQVT